MYSIALSQDPPSALWFLRRRVERVAPIYYVITLAWLPFVGALDRQVGLPDIATSLLFWPAWRHLAVPVLSVGWTLSFEMLFYCSVALVLASRRWMLVLLAGFVLCWLARLETGFTVFRFLGNPILLEFLLGMAIAAAKPQAPFWAGAILLAMGFSGLLLWFPDPGLAGTTISGASSFARFLHWGLPAGLILAGALVVEPVIHGPWLRFAVGLGDASYATYLIHWPMMALANHALAKFWVSWPAWIEVISLVLGALVAGLAVHRLFERPILHYIRSAWPGGALKSFPAK